MILNYYNQHQIRALRLQPTKLAKEEQFVVTKGRTWNIKAKRVSYAFDPIEKLSLKLRANEW